MRTRVGLDQLLSLLDDDPGLLEGRHYGLLCHQASIDQNYSPAHTALAGRGFVPTRLFGPEHGFYGVEQDMITADAQIDPLTGVSVVSLYQDEEDSLVPSAAAFDQLDLLIVDLQDIGTRYYTFAATAVWSAQVALEHGCEVWILDRPNPLGGQIMEGNLVEPGMTSFVSAFALPVRHGLSLAELMLFELKRLGVDCSPGASQIRVFEADEWADRRPASMTTPFVAPSPNMPTLATAQLYPGLCLIEGTELSEGRGTTRPFHLIGAPFIDPRALVKELELRAVSWAVEGLDFMPAFFRPQFQKHANEVCGGIELVVSDADRLRSLTFGVLLLQTIRDLWPNDFEWRTRAYEFVTDRPAIDLLAGTSQLRNLIDAGDDQGLRDWVSSWSAVESQFERARSEVLLYGSKRDDDAADGSGSR